jgi:hypothetical protein
MRAPVVTDLISGRPARYIRKTFVASGLKPLPIQAHPEPNLVVWRGGERDWAVLLFLANRKRRPPPNDRFRETPPIAQASLNDRSPPTAADSRTIKD